jgi:hypothetical protein
MVVADKLGVVNVVPIAIGIVLVAESYQLIMPAFVEAVSVVLVF